MSPPRNESARGDGRGETTRGQTDNQHLKSYPVSLQDPIRQSGLVHIREVLRAFIGELEVTP